MPPIRACLALMHVDGLLSTEQRHCSATPPLQQRADLVQDVPEQHRPGLVVRPDQDRRHTVALLEGRWRRRRERDLR